jgi:hypothetical protein
MKRQFLEWLLDFALRHHPDVKRSRYLEYAKDEMKGAGLYDEDADYGDMLPKAVLRLLSIHAIESHSGGSHAMTSSIFKQVSNFRPLLPLTGHETEWNEVGPDTWQNRRCSTIFRDKNGNAHNIEGKIFEEPDGSRYTSRDSHVPINFPWAWREPEIVKVRPGGW